MEHPGSSKSEFRPVPRVSDIPYDIYIHWTLTEQNHMDTSHSRLNQPFQFFDISIVRPGKEDMFLPFLPFLQFFLSFSVAVSGAAIFDDQLRPLTNFINNVLRNSNRHGWSKYYDHAHQRCGWLSDVGYYATCESIDPLGGACCSSNFKCG